MKSLFKRFRHLKPERHKGGMLSHGSIDELIVSGWGEGFRVSLLSSQGDYPPHVVEKGREGRQLDFKARHLDSGKEIVVTLKEIRRSGDSELTSFMQVSASVDDSSPNGKKIISMFEHTFD